MQRPPRAGPLAVGDVHRDFEAEAQVGELRFGPLHDDLLVWYGLVRILIASWYRPRRGVTARQSIMINATSMPEPWDEGCIDVGAGHRLYYAQYGHAGAPAAVVLHGGPGSGFHPSMLEWFDLARWRVVLFDQRGAGRSIAADPLAHNTSADLVGDIERLRLALGIGCWTVVGGSWGATLALLYAGHHPDAVSALILRGAFLAAQSDVDWFFQGLRTLAPEAWKGLTAGWTEEEQRSVFQTLAALLQSATVEDRQNAARRWGTYEAAVMLAMAGHVMEADDAGQQPMVPHWMRKYQVQAHYLASGCFTSEAELRACAARTAGIPVTILHGTHDWICRPVNALRLKQWMPHAWLRWVARGAHSPSDQRIRDALRAEIADCVRMRETTEEAVWPGAPELCRLD
jgi:proline iminopeptidase